MVYLMEFCMDLEKETLSQQEHHGFTQSSLHFFEGAHWRDDGGRVRQMVDCIKLRELVNLLPESRSWEMRASGLSY